jgi:hypothetical protein
MDETNNFKKSQNNTQFQNLDEAFELEINGNNRNTKSNRSDNSKLERDEWDIDGVTKKVNMGGFPIKSRDLFTSMNKQSNSGLNTNNKLAPSNYMIEAFSNVKNEPTNSNYILNKKKLFEDNKNRKLTNDEELLYDESIMHIKNDIKNEKFQIENLHCGIDDFSKDNINKRGRLLVGHTPMKSVMKIGFNDEEVNSNKKVEGIINRKNKKKNEVYYGNLIDQMKVCSVNREGKFLDIDKSVLGGENDNSWVLNLKIKEKK